MLSLLKKVWARWTVIAHKIGNFQSRVMLSVFYVVVVGPFAMVYKIFADPLRLKGGAVPGWLSRPSPVDDPLAQARRQF